MAAIAALLFCADCWAQAKKGISLADLAAYTGADREQLDRIGNSSPIRPVFCQSALPRYFHGSNFLSDNGLNGWSICL
jgi:hypothetical protein